MGKKLLSKSPSGLAESLYIFLSNSNVTLLSPLKNPSPKKLVAMVLCVCVTTTLSSETKSYLGNPFIFLTLSIPELKLTKLVAASAFVLVSPRTKTFVAKNSPACLGDLSFGGPPGPPGPPSAHQDGSMLINDKNMGGSCWNMSRNTNLIFGIVGIVAIVILMVFSCVLWVLLHKEKYRKYVAVE